MIRKRGFSLLEIMFGISLASFAVMSIFLFLNQLNRMTHKTITQSNTFFEKELIKNGFYARIFPKFASDFKVKNTGIKPFNFNNYEGINQIESDEKKIALKYIYENKEFLEKQKKKNDKDNKA